MSNFKTEAEAIYRLRKHVQDGTAEILVAGIRNQLGSASPWGEPMRTADALSIGVYPSRELMVSFYEVKCNRGDWLAELKDPSKAAAFTRYANFIWLVIPDRRMVHDGELPEGWGLLVAYRDGLRRITVAIRQEVEPMPLAMMARMLVADRARTNEAIVRAVAIIKEGTQVLNETKGGSDG